MTGPRHSRAEHVSRSPTALRARDVSFAYDGHVVLDGLSLDVEPRTSTAIMGQSGSGKSTLLQVLAGMMAPSAGHVLVDELPFSSSRPAARSAVRLRRFGFVFQFGELLPELSLVENVELPLLLLGVRRSRARPRAVNALHMVGLSEHITRSVAQVSGGQAQRASIARALVHGPSMILADEPTGSLDEEATDQVLDVLLGQADAQNASVVVVTHSPQVAARCGRTLTLVDGQLA